MQRIDETNIDLHTNGFIGGFYIRPMPQLKSGASHDGHEHYIDHLMNLVRGAVRIEWRNKKSESGVVEALVPCRLLIKADCYHKLTALTDDTFWECWFSEAEAEKAYAGQQIPWHLEKPVE